MTKKQNKPHCNGACLEPCENCMCQDTANALPCQSHRDRIQAAIKRYTERVNGSRL